MLGSAGGVQIGIESTPTAFRAAAVRHGRAVAAVEVHITDAAGPRGEAARRAFAALERQGVNAFNACIAVAPMAGMTNTVLELPPRSSGAPLEELAAAEMTRGLGGDGLELALFPIRSRDNGPTEYFVTAAQREAVLGLVSDVAAAGGELIAVDAPVTALARAACSANCLVASVESDAIAFHAVQGGIPILSRAAPVAGGRVTSDMLIAEIDRCAGYLATYRADTAIEELLLVGRTELVPDAARDIAIEFDVKVRQWEMPGSFQWASESSAVFAGAFGAATWGVKAGAAA